METTEIKNLLKEKNPQGYSFNQFALFDYPYTQITKVARVKRVPDKDLNNLYHIVLRAVQAGIAEKKALADFLGISEQDDFIKNEFLFLVKQGFINDDIKQYSLTELGKAYIRDEIPPIWVEDTINYNFLIDTLTGNLHSLSKIKDIGKSNTGRGLTPDPSIFNQCKKYLKQEQLRDLFHNDYQGEALLLSFKNEQYQSKLVWRPLILAEYTANDYENPPYYTVRSADGIYQDFELTDEFNTRLMKHIPYLFA
ncbi:MAG: hypothetical protein J6Y35_02760 [Bacteroidales bacterium]|nr:hypothetical protein [Bacteroidales bacterium]